MIQDRITDESGIEVMEFAFLMPILFCVGMAAIQFCFTAFFALSLEAQVSNASWNVNPAALVQSVDKGQTFKDAICANSVLDADKVTVANMQVSTRDVNDETEIPDSDPSIIGMPSTYTHDRSLVTVECDVSYEAPSILSFAGIGDFTLKRHVERTLVASDRVEVG